MTVEERLDRLEGALSRLAEAQTGTEERMGRLQEAMAALAAAQARTEERVGRLAEAQARTEGTEQMLVQQVGRLEEAQARTEERVGRLAEAQARTEAMVQTLAQQAGELNLRVGELAQQVGRLANIIGFTLENLGREVTPAYLAQHYGIHVPQLDRHFIMLDGQELDLDLYGEGQRDGEAITVVGEVRSRIYGRDVEDAIRRVMRLAPQLPGTPVTVLFSFVIHPSARDAARRLGAIVISFSGR